MAERYAREQDRYLELAQCGPSAPVMIIACCDSRAAPETVFNAGPGELFVLRNVANLVPPYEPGGGQHGTSAAIEFAVNSVGVQHIVVMGHGRCGGIRAALGDGAPLAPGDFIGKWMSLLRPVTEEVAKYTILTEQERHTALERLSIRNSIRNLRTFPYVQQLEAEGRLEVHGAWFDIHSGELWLMDPETGDFVRPDA